MIASLRELDTDRPLWLRVAEAVGPMAQRDLPAPRATLEQLRRRLDDGAGDALRELLDRWCAAGDAIAAGRGSLVLG